jgi:hypothetical protein
MAKKITIPLTDHEANCTGYYLVEYKLTGATGYNSFTSHTDQVQINNLADDSTYDVRITRQCCNGSTSAPLVLVVDTATLSPVLDVPTGFALTPADGQVSADCDDVTEAETYIWEIATDDEFTTNRQMATTTDSSTTFTELTNGTVYYMHVKARASGYADSEWTTTASATPAP